MNRRSFIKTGLIYVPTAAIVPACLADRRRAQFQQKASVSGGACATTQQDNSGTFDSYKGFDAFYSYVATQFTTGGSGYTVCKATLKLKRTGTLSGTVQVKMYANSGNNPSTLVGTGSATVDVTTISTSEADVDFTGMSAALSASTTYFVVLQGSSAFNNIQWTAHSGANLNRGSTDGSSWDNLGAATCEFILYSE